jgi:hypothetical protein
MIDMSDLSFQEKRTVEQFLNMAGGYVLDFSNRTFQEFVGSAINIDIDEPKYEAGGTSKANRLREFIRVENDYTVGLLFKHLYEYQISELKRREFDINQHLVEQFHKISERLLEGNIIEHIDAIQANNDDKDFHQLAKLIKESIQKNEPEAALDRLHVFLIKFLKELCTSHGTTFSQEETVNALFGKYIKTIKAKGFIQSPMAEKIIQFSFQVIDAFNDIRNNRSFAHDNPVLNYDESVLVFSNVTSTVKFLQSLELKNKNTVIAEAQPDWGQF